MGERLRASLEQLIPNYDSLFDSVRGRGLMQGLRLKHPSRDFVAHLRDHHGLLTVAAGDNTVRLLPPYVIEDAHIAEANAKLSEGARTDDTGRPTCWDRVGRSESFPVVAA